MTILQQPSADVMSLSPVIYGLSDALYATSGFEYVLEVFLWTGDVVTDKPAQATYTLSRLPDTNGVAWFDVSGLLRSKQKLANPQSYLFGSNRTIKGTLNPAQTIWISVTGSYRIDGGALQSKTNSNTKLALRGWTGHRDGVNATRGPILNTLTDGLYMPNSVPFSISVLTSGVDEVTILNEAGIGAVFDLGSADQTESDERLYTILIDGLTTLDLFRAFVEHNGGTCESTECSLNSYQDTTTATVEFRNDGNMVDTWTVYPDCGYQYEPYVLLYQNEYGAWEGMPAYLQSTESLGVSRESSQNSYLLLGSLTASYSGSEPSTRIHRAQGTIDIQVNTGYQPESIWQQIQGLMLTERAYLVSSGGVNPVVVVDESMTKRQHTNDKLVSYTVALRTAVQVTNQVSL